MKILVTGGDGYIARSFLNAYKGSAEITVIGRRVVDISEADEVNHWFEGKFFDTVIHTAAVGGSRLTNDDESVFEKNVLMFENLRNHRDKFGKLVSFGSGAEIWLSTPYAKSKKYIADQIRNDQKCHNIRIFATFDHNELPTRFIKSSLIRYINSKPILIHRDKVMDFFYMEDLVSMISYFIDSNCPPKEIDCSYSESISLMEIAQFINTLSYHKVQIKVQEDGVDFYNGFHTELGLSFLGLKEGIMRTYERLKVSEK